MEDYRQHLIEAINLAKQAGAAGNHPCGTVIVNAAGEVVAASGNEVFTTPDITAHAEMMCLRQHSDLFMDKNAQGYVLFSSCEPCCGCAFYIARTNIKKIVYAAKDRYRPGIEMLKTMPEFQDYFRDIELISEPLTDLRDAGMIPMRDYFLSKGRADTAKFFDPASLLL